MPLVKDPPPRRRLGKSNGDNIIALFEGSATKETGGELQVTTTSPMKKQQTNNDHEDGETNENNNNEQLIASLFPSKHNNKNSNTSEEEEAPCSFNDNSNPAPLPAPRRANSTMTNNSSSAATAAAPSSSASVSFKKPAANPNAKFVSTEVQTDTGGAEFRLYELVLTSPNPHGIVTREHAAHRAMLERQISQRIVDARLDERFNRQSIEDARDAAFETVASAYKFHSEAMNDLLFLKQELNSPGEEEEEEDGEDTDPEVIQQKLIARMNNANKNNRRKLLPRLVPVEKYQQAREENDALRDRVDLLERRLQAQSQGIPYLVNTVRFPPPPPSIEVLENEEERVRSRLLDLEDELISNLVSIWATPPTHLLRAYRASRQQQQQIQMTMSVDQRIQSNVVDVEEKERSVISNEQDQEFKNEIEASASATFFTNVVRGLNAEKEMYRLRCDLLVVEASEESSRHALTETVLDVRQTLLETFYNETKAKSELTRKLRSSLQDQHNQAMRHKKEISKNLPPVADRVGPKNSSVKITPEARRAAAIALHEQRQHPQYKSQSANATPNTKNTARSLGSDLMLPAIDGNKSSKNNKNSTSALTPRPPQQQQQQSQQQQQASASTSRRTLGGFSSSYAKASLYNSGFSRPYENL